MAEEEQFRRAVALLRKQRGFSQERLAKDMHAAGWTDFHQATISRIEKGTRPVRLGEARTLAKLLGADIDSMLTPSALSRTTAQAQADLNAYISKFRAAVQSVADAEEARTHLETLRRTLRDEMAQVELKGKDAGRAMAISRHLDRALDWDTDDVAQLGFQRAKRIESAGDSEAPAVFKSEAAEIDMQSWPDDADEGHSREP